MYFVIFLLYYNVYLERTTTLRPREGVSCRMIIFTYVTLTNNQTKQSCEAYTERISVNEIIREGVAFSQCLTTVCLVLSLAAYPSGYCRNDNHTRFNPVPRRFCTRGCKSFGLIISAMPDPDS